MATKTINVILPEGARLEVSIDADRMTLINVAGIKFKAKVVAVASKIPNFFYSNYRPVAYVAEILVS